MPQDDYGKVLFMILYGLYDDLKNGKPANLDDISPATLGVNESYWLSIVEEALEDGFVKGPTIRQTKFGRIVGGWSYVKKTDTDFRESADTANSTKDFLRFLP